MADNEGFNRDLAAAAREMQGENSSEEAMEKAVAIATEILSGCDAAGVCVVHRGERVDTLTTTAEALRQADGLQHELAEGPCVDALEQDDTVVSHDLSVDSRWPRWGPRVSREHGYFSIVSYRLFSTSHSLGALNLYGLAKSAFDNDDIADGLALAAHIGVALAGAQEAENLQKAMGSRTVVGQATGILMERFDLSSDRAFGALTRLSQQRNVKLRQVAEQIVDTKSLTST